MSTKDHDSIDDPSTTTFESSSSTSNYEEIDIGTKLENYYIALREGEISNILYYLSLIENHIPLLPSPPYEGKNIITDNNGTIDLIEVVSEIISSCREKTAQYYRINHCNEFLNILIINIRKKLMIKVSTTSSLSSSSSSLSSIQINHQQRHLICLIDLLGSFSNLILDFQTLNISIPTQIMILIPMHNTRIKDCILEIYNSFKEDKNLESIQRQILASQQQQTKQKHSSNGSSLSISSSVSFAILDNLLFQISTFRQTIVHYYRFLSNTFLQPFQQYEDYIRQLNLTQPALLITNNTTTAKLNDGNNSSSINNSTNIKHDNSNSSSRYSDISNNGHTSNTNKPILSSGDIYYPSEQKQQIQTIYNELSSTFSKHYRELDAYYLSFEYQYLTLTITSAIQYKNLLHIERLVYVPQNIEDIFYLFQKVTERAVSLKNDSLLFAVGNKIIEMLDPEVTIESNSNGGESLTINQYIQSLLQQNMSNNDSNNGRQTSSDYVLNVYLIFAYKYGFHNCNKRQSIQLASTASTTANRTDDSNNIWNPNSTPNNRSIHTLQQQQYQQQQTPPSSLNGNSNNANSNKNMTTPNRNTTTASATSDSVTQSATQKSTPPPPSHSSALDLGAWLVEALTNEIDDEEDTYNFHTQNINVGNSNNSNYATTMSNDNTASSQKVYSNNSTNCSNTNDNDSNDDNVVIHLRTDDMCVYISTLSTCVLSIQSLISLYQAVLDETTVNSAISITSSNNASIDANSTAVSSPLSSQLSPLLLTIQELTRCHNQYSQLFNTECQLFCTSFFTTYFQPTLITLIEKKSFHIDGKTMDKLMIDEPISSFFKHQLFGSSSSSSSSSMNGTSNSSNTHGGLSTLCEIKERLTSHACKQLIYLLATQTVQQLFLLLLAERFSEWGAIYIQHEIMCIIGYFDQVYSPCITAVPSITNVLLTNVQPTNGVANMPKTNSGNNASNINSNNNSNNNNKDNCNNTAISHQLSMRQLFAPLYWFGTIITLDQPGAIRRYNLPVTVFSHLSLLPISQSSSSSTVATTTSMTTKAQNGIHNSTVNNHLQSMDSIHTNINCSGNYTNISASNSNEGNLQSQVQSIITSIMKCRVDFSADAINKIKINFLPS